MKILYVEDDKDYFDLIQVQLHGLGVYITWAANKAEALQAVAEGRCDALICDYYLPDGSGVETIAEARKLDPGLPAVLISGVNVPEKELRSLEDVDFILKPDADTSAFASQIVKFIAHELRVSLEEVLRKNKKATKKKGPGLDSGRST